jgi:hypothetical protein
MIGEDRPRGSQIREDLSPEDQKYAKLVLDVKDRFSHRRWLFEREWYRNILFYLGQQWVVYDETFRRWRRRNMPAWVPLPITNRLASTVNTIRSSISQVQPSFDARPMQENEKSVLSANSSEKYLDILQNESGFRSARRRMASWVTLTGNAFLFQEYDTSIDTGTVFIPGETCSDCGAKIAPNEIPESNTCPKCGSPNLQEDADSGITVPQGKSRTRALSPFEVYVDPYIMDIQEQPAVLIIETRSLQAIKQVYGDKAKDLKADMDRTIGRYYLDSLAYMTGSGYGGGGSFGRVSTPENDDVYGACTLYRLFIKSHPDYPQGIYIVMGGDQTVLEVVKPMPTRYRTTQEAFYPLIHIKYDDVPGRFWGKTPVDDLVPKQRQRNEMESLYQTIIMRTANPVWLIPLNIQTSPITGDPSLVIRYTGTQGQKPERMPGMDVPMSVPKFIEMIDADFEELANTFAVMKGKSPGNVRAASAIQMLIERGFGRYGTVFDNLEEAYENWAIQTLEIWRQRAVFPRVQAVSKVSGSWQFMEFLGADLDDVDIRVEAGSTRPKSQAGRQMLIQQLMQMQLLNPNDPEQRMKMFEEMGATSLMPGAEADIKCVARENAQFKEWGQRVTLQEQQGGADIPPEAIQQVAMQTFPLHGNPIIDHHPTHLIHHRRFALTDEFKAMSQVAQQLFVQHMITAHYMPMLQELQTGIGPTGIVAAMMAAQQPQGGPGKGPNQQPKKESGSQSPMGMGTKVQPTMGSY